MKLSVVLNIDSLFELTYGRAASVLGSDTLIVTAQTPLAPWGSTLGKQPNEPPAGTTRRKTLVNTLFKYGSLGRLGEVAR